MNDKQQIEEMAKDLKTIRELQASDIYTPTYFEADCMFNLGYRKLPEDAVVLTREEYDDIAECYEIYRGEAYKIRKETAREILKALKAKAWQGYDVGMYIVSTDEILELAKQYGVEVE